MSKPIIVVFAATGKSGAGMVEAILKDGTFQARAITRNPESSSAKALAAKGVEVVKADLSDPSTLAPAMEGAYGVFGVTDFWQAFMAEEQQGKDMVDAAKQAGVKHFVWTTLDYSDWHVPHFETKARVDDYLKSSGVPRTSLYLSFFAENLYKSSMLPFKRGEDGKVKFQAIPKTDGPLPIIAASDIGYWALAVFKNPEEWIGKDFKLCTEWLTPREIVKLVEEAIGEPISVDEVDANKWKAMEENKQLHELSGDIQTSRVEQQGPP
ncbi:NmrA-like domain-containing protein 1 [Serendipita sp. 400]|nr:NmrA-like domain-containing protein 1 [Serendipita sp. 400]